MKKKPFDQVLYLKRKANSLLLFSIFSIEERKEKCTFERLIKECFVLFPESFRFSSLLEWPDARKLDRPLRTLRKRKLITGSPQTYFSLTKTGEKLAKEILKTFRQKKLEI